MAQELHILDQNLHAVGHTTAGSPEEPATSLFASSGWASKSRSGRRIAGYSGLVISIKIAFKSVLWGDNLKGTAAKALSVINSASGSFVLFS
ncbi:MAG: hypothetical protein ACLPHP_11350 [Candidatus Sulfotelmatobacter sp.]